MILDLDLRKDSIPRRLCKGAVRDCEMRNARHFKIPLAFVTFEELWRISSSIFNRRRSLFRSLLSICVRPGPEDSAPHRSLASARDFRPAGLLDSTRRRDSGGFARVRPLR